MLLNGLQRPRELGELAMFTEGVGRVALARGIASPGPKEDVRCHERGDEDALSWGLVYLGHAARLRGRRRAPGSPATRFRALWNLIRARHRAGI